MADFTLTPRLRLTIAVWLSGLIALTLLVLLTDVDDTFAGGALGAWCGLAVAVVMVMRERAKKSKPSQMARDRYGKR